MAAPATSPVMTNFEYTAVLAHRAEMLAGNAPTVLTTEEVGRLPERDPVCIARAELGSGRLDFLTLTRSQPPDTINLRVCDLKLPRHSTDALLLTGC